MKNTQSAFDVRSGRRDCGGDGVIPTTVEGDAGMGRLPLLRRGMGKSSRSSGRTVNTITIQQNANHVLPPRRHANRSFWRKKDKEQLRQHHPQQQQQQQQKQQIHQVGNHDSDDDLGRSTYDEEGEKDMDRKEYGKTVQQQQQQQQQQQSTTMVIEELQENIRILKTKCNALESQNILVPVQQLDWLVMIVSWSLSILTLYFYWTFVSSMVVPTVLNLFIGGYDPHQQQEQQEQQQQQQQGPSVTTIIFIPSTTTILSIFVQLGLLILPYYYNSITHGSFHRRFQVFAVAFIVIGRIRLCRWREKTFVQQLGNNNNNNNSNDGSNVQPFGEGCTEDGIWEANYEISARFLYLSVARLRGLWTKSAQYLSSRADFMPLSYVRELSKLQDSAPATDWKDVEHMLPPSLRRRIVQLDTVPLASASIGQVHVATIRTGKDHHLGQQSKHSHDNNKTIINNDNNNNDDDDDDDDGHDILQKVVIKVQHPHARTLMMDDFWSLIVICRIVGWLEPDYAFMEILMREWANEARKELDFTNELYHLQEAQKAVLEMFPSSTSVAYTNSHNESTSRVVPFRVQVPSAMPEYSNRNVLVMEYCEGCRVDDFAQLTKWKLDRLNVMDGLAQTFAHFMYCSTIFNGDPHPGNLFCRPGLGKTIDHGNNKEEGAFTLVLLDWGLAKQLPGQKRLAFCQMVYAASTLDYGLLLDSYKTLGLRMKREDAGQSMEDMRFFLRDMAPRSKARERIKSKMKQGQDLAQKNKEKVPMESKAYPGELFFFIRVNELLHGLGSKFHVDLKYLDTLRPYAERGLRHLQTLSSSNVELQPAPEVSIASPELQTKLETALSVLEKEGKLAGGQICVLDSKGEVQVDVVAGNLGGLRDHIPMERNVLVLGYSCTKAITATLAHCLVHEGYVSLDEPICNRVWTAFCPTETPPPGLARAVGMSTAEVQKRWKWKRQITLRHILNHTAGFWSALPKKLTVKSMASCEVCITGFEYNAEKPEDTLLPSRMPGEMSEYHFLSYGWLVAGTLRGAYSVKHGCPEVTYGEVYETVLYPKLSADLRYNLGFRPMGGGSDQFVIANTVTSDVSASKMMQEQREKQLEANNNSGVVQDGKQKVDESTLEVMKTFKGVEFLLDPRIWNSQDALHANVPAAGGRFSAAALARFYHELGNIKSFISESVLDEVSNPVDVVGTSTTNAMQGVTRIATDGGSHRTKLCLGYQLMQTERDNENVYSGIGHAGVGGSVGFWHRGSGLSIGVMFNKADGGEAVTLAILKVICDHYNI